MRALLSKELDALRPYVAAALGLLLMQALLHMATPMGRMGPSELLEEGLFDWTLFSCLLMFAVGHGSVSREFRDGHIEFLDGLPVRRSQVFLAKLLASLAPALCLLSGTAALKVAALTLFADPLTLPFAQALGLHLGVYAAQMLGFLGLGLALSWLGTLGWGVLALGMVGALIWGIEHPGVRAYLPVEALDELVYSGRAVEAAPGMQAVWWAIGAAGAAVTWVAFLGPGELLVRSGARVMGPLRLVAMGCVGATLLLCSGAMTLGMVVGEADRLWVSSLRASSGSLSFLYLEEHREAAEQLIAESARLDSLVRQRMGDLPPAPLDIELMGTPRFHAGRFTGGRVRLSVDADAHTLAHELAHAYAFQLSGGQSFRHLEHMRFFEEGHATWMAHQVDPIRWQLEQERLNAAALRRTRQADFSLLVEDERRGRDHDETQVYPLGLVFVEALVQERGPDAPACVLRQLSALGPEQRSGLALWLQLMEGCDAQLDPVVARYEALLQDYGRELPDALPRPIARVVVEGDQLVLVVTDRAGLDLPMTCRVRDDPEDPLERQLLLRVEDSRCVLDLDFVSDRSFEYQLGFDDVTAGRVFLEWTSAPVP